MTPDMSNWDADAPELDVAWWEARSKHIPSDAKREFGEFLVALRIYNANPMPETRRTFGVCADRLLLGLVDRTKVTLGYMITSISRTARTISDQADRQSNVKSGVENTRRAVTSIKNQICGEAFVPGSAVMFGDRVPPVPAQYSV